MRSGLPTILQTLNPEAAAVLTHSIAEAGRRNHNQTTPLHVAAALLAAPTGFLRQACIRSHPNSSHPLQCRALELCFSVALDRLTSSASSPASAEPPVSNALMAALKRAQAHQRRGCPEQQQQPLLAVKVELEQLIVSILDDPSVSRVMREAGFSSPAVKATIEQSLNNINMKNSSTFSGENHHIFRQSPMNQNLYYNPRLQKNDENLVSLSPQNNLYLNPRLQHQSRMDDIKRVIDTMSKSKKKNPILVGEYESEWVKKEILMRIKNGEFSPSPEFKNPEVIAGEFPPEKSDIPARIKELSELINFDGGNRSIVVDLGDLKWVIGSDMGREAVAEMGSLMAKLAAEERRVWLIGTATCETYLRCQIYHPTMENDWDLQALPVSSRSPFSGRLNSFNMAAQALPSCCPKCFHDYEQELEKLSVEVKSDLPQWLQNAKAQRCEAETDIQSETRPPHRPQVHNQELMKKWSEICSRIHPNHKQIASVSRMGMGIVPMYRPNTFLCQTGQHQEALAPPSLVHTDLVLGLNEVHEDLPVKDYNGCISSELPKGKFVNSADTDSFKKLLKRLMKMAWWQPEAASTIATTVTQRSTGPLWLLFAGPDRVGKKKMASVLAEHVFGADPTTICLGSRRYEDERDCGFRGKTTMDRIVDEVRRNPCSVIMLLDIDEADMLVCGSIKEAMKRGRMMDSHGREVSLGNVIFVLTGNWSTNNGDEVIEKNNQKDWRLKLTICKKQLKRRADWLSEVNSSPKQQKKVGSGLSLDLNLAVDTEEERTDTSDLTIEQGDENPQFASTSVSVPHELAGPSDVTVMFKPVEFRVIRHEIEKTVKNTFSTVLDVKLSIEVDEATIDNIVSGLWFGKAGLEDWAEGVLVPSCHKLVGQLPSLVDGLEIRLESDCNLEQSNHGKDRLPSKIEVMVDIV